MTDDHSDDKDRHLSGWLEPATPAMHDLVAHACRRIDTHEGAAGLRQRVRRPADASTLYTTVGALICEVAHHHLSAEAGGIAVPMSNVVLERRSRYRPRAFNGRLPHVVGIMVEAGLLKLVAAGHGPQRQPNGRWKAPRRTTVRAGSLLLTAIDERGITFDDIGRDSGEELVILRGVKERRGGTRTAPRLDYRDDAHTCHLREQLRATNTYLAAASLTLAERHPGEWRHIDVGARRLTRVFNNGRWDHGGRLGGRPFWLQISRADRLACVRINGEAVVGLDFSAMFLRLAYARCGLVPPQADPYGIPGFEGFRTGCKRLISARLFDTGPRRSKPSDIAHLLPPAPLRELLASIEGAHPAIRHLFGCGIGFELMHTESNILVDVLTELRSRGIVGLPCHDAVVVRASVAAEVEEVMVKVGHQHCGQVLPVSREGG